MVVVRYAAVARHSRNCHRARWAALGRDAAQGQGWVTCPASPAAEPAEAAEAAERDALAGRGYPGRRGRPRCLGSWRSSAGCWGNCFCPSTFRSPTWRWATSQQRGSRKVLRATPPAHASLEAVDTAPARSWAHGGRDGYELPRTSRHPAGATSRVSLSCGSDGHRVRADGIAERATTSGRRS